MIDDNRKYTFAILGGDRRQAIVAKRLLDKGHFIKLFGLGTFTADIGCAEICSTCEKAISGSDFVLLPLPATKDKVNLALVSDHTPISLASIVELASKYKCKGILGGILPKEMEHIASVKNVTLYDFYLDESFQKKNALPSAEGALMIAMEHTEKTVKGMKALVCGYGRIGSQLSSILKALGASVSIASRSDSSLCEASMSGYQTARIDGYGTALAEVAQDCDVIFNTAPAIIFGEQVISKMKKYPLYVEIASSPGGIDLSCARERQMRLIFAPSIPGKYAPASAGEYIFETICDILNKRGIRL